MPRMRRSAGINHMARATNAPTLSDLRAEIDRIDEAMHGLLIERGGIIENLIAVKRTQESGSAFRPARGIDRLDAARNQRKH